MDIPTTSLAEFLHGWASEVATHADAGHESTGQEWWLACQAEYRRHAGLPYRVVVAETIRED